MKWTAGHVFLKKIKCFAHGNASPSPPSLSFHLYSTANTNVAFNCAGTSIKELWWIFKKRMSLRKTFEFQRQSIETQTGR